MSEGKGISGTILVAGLIGAIIISTIFSIVIITQTNLAQGPQGETGPQGNTGPQGPQGETGPQGPSGTVPADVEALITETFVSVWPGTDRHQIEGFIINFGTETAYNAKIELTWDSGGGMFVFQTIEVGNVWGHYVGNIGETYYFEGQGAFSYEITWD